MASALLSNRRREEVGSEPSVIVGGPRSINDFPDEILLKILSYAGPEDLGLIYPKVCERWNNLTKDMTLWKTLTYICDHTSDISHVVQVLTVAPALHSLVINSRKDAAHILKTLFDSRVNLRKLRLMFCDVNKNITNTVTLYPDLESLSLEHCYVHSPAGDSFISHLKKLTELNLSYCQGMCTEIVRTIADRCQHLKKLNLCDVYQIGDDDVIDIIKKLGKQLTTLALNGGYLTDAAYLYLNKCSRLQELQVPICGEMTDRGLLEGIGPLQELTSLRLTEGVDLTAQALSRFLHRPSMTSIVSLNLSRCYNLDDTGLKGIAKSCVQLKELVVVGCKNVTDAGISMVVGNCRQLRVLDLSGLHHIRGNRWLPLVPACLPHLRELGLVGCDSVCNVYIETLKAATPELQVS